MYVVSASSAENGGLLYMAPVGQEVLSNSEHGKYLMTLLLQAWDFGGRVSSSVVVITGRGQRGDTGGGEGGMTCPQLSTICKRGGWGAVCENHIVYGPHACSWSHPDKGCALFIEPLQDPTLYLFCLPPHLSLSAVRAAVGPLAVIDLNACVCVCLSVFYCERTILLQP